MEMGGLILLLLILYIHSLDGGTQSLPPIALRLSKPYPEAEKSKDILEENGMASMPLKTMYQTFPIWTWNQLIRQNISKHFHAFENQCDDRKAERTDRQCREESDDVEISGDDVATSKSLQERDLTIYLPISQFHWAILVENFWLWPYPLLVPTGIRERVRHLTTHYKGKYCWATSFEPKFVATLMAEGFLPMAEEADRGPLKYLLVPKLHFQRCVLRFEDLHITRTVRKRSKRFDITCDTCLDRVIDGCLRQHGENWLRPPIVETFRQIFLSGGVCGVRIHSFEVWVAEGGGEGDDAADLSNAGLECAAGSSADASSHATGQSGASPVRQSRLLSPSSEGILVAGEFGYSVGGCYTSLSGFSLVDSSGSVQCVCTALLLRLAGAEAWDLGMSMPYKTRLGARRVARRNFLRQLAVMRASPPLALPRGRTNALRLIRLAAALWPAAPVPMPPCQPVDCVS